MTKKYEILGKYIKDLSSETPDVETYLYVKENISTIQNHKVYFDRGTRGLDYLYKKPQEDVDKLFFDNNINFETQVYKGHDHDPVDFGKRFIPAIEFLL